MDMFCITGGTRLNGSVRVEGSKNSALPILAASVAISGEVTLRQVPKLQDVTTMSTLLQGMGAIVERDNSDAVIMNSNGITSTVAPYELVRQMRAGICVLGPLLTRFGTATVALPGGCRIGHRPVDLHLRGLAALGADIRIESGNIVASARQLQGCDLNLLGTNGPTVTGTCNIMVAATLARGTTVIRNAAREPEVADLARFLNSAGANIEGQGTSVIEIRGVEELGQVQHTIIADRIEAATLAIAAAITNGCILIENAPSEQMHAVLSILQQIGVDVELSSEGLHVSAGEQLLPVVTEINPYPGFPTDVQAQLMALLTLVPGESRITDNVFPERFMHAAELIRMGADIQVRGNSAIIRGVPSLSAAPVMASDLRASAALVLAGIAAKGITEIRRVYHLYRGYQQFDSKLNSLGASILRVDDSPDQGSLPIPAPKWDGRSVLESGD
ncbi:MAG: UDP-N-acetylglucosamine 1-carboxyvinyltransferase [Planctomycetaceae bacterium]